MIGAWCVARSEDLLKAAEWWRLYQTAAQFIIECEQRWRNQTGCLTAEQQKWLTWARDNAKAMSPFETGYPVTRPRMELLMRRLFRFADHIQPSGISRVHQ